MQVIVANTVYNTLATVDTVECVAKVTSLVDDVTEADLVDRIASSTVKISVVVGDVTVACLVISNNDIYADAVVIYSDDRYATIIMMYYLWENYDVRYIRFVPHDNNINGIISIATGESIRRWHNKIKNYVVIDVEALYRKLDGMLPWEV